MNETSARSLLARVGVRVEGDSGAAARVLRLLDAAPPPHSLDADWLILHVLDGAPPTPGRQVLAQPPVDISLDGGGTPVIVAEGVGVVAREIVELRIAPSAEDRLVRAVMDATWPLVLPRFGAFHVHGGAVRDHEGRGWLLAGDAGSGKSTTVLSLALEGWGWASDDATYLRRDHSQVVAEGWREAPRLSSRSAAALRLSREDATSPFKTSAALPQHVLAAREASIELHRLLLPEIAGATRLERIEPAKALDGLLRASAWLVCLPAMARDYLRLLAEVAALPAWRLLLGPELLEEPARAASLLAECAP